MNRGRFPEAVRKRLAAAREVRIETSRGRGQPVHRVVIWIVVDDAGRVLIRSWLGREARWYREATANPRGAVWIGEDRVPVRFKPASDPESVAAADAGYRSKYRRSGQSLQEMLDPQLAETTLELLPARARRAAGGKATGAARGKAKAAARGRERPSAARPRGKR
jgi:hypothetical protein